MDKNAIMGQCLDSIKSFLVWDKVGHFLLTHLQMQVAEAEGLPLDDLAVYCNGCPLEDNMELSSCTGLSTLDVEVRMLGGRLAYPISCYQ